MAAAFLFNHFPYLFKHVATPAIQWDRNYGPSAPGFLFKENGFYQNYGAEHVNCNLENFEQGLQGTLRRRSDVEDISQS